LPSAYDLTYEIVQREFPHGAQDEEKREIYRKILELLRRGWTATDVLAAKQVEGGNLLKSGVFYFHSELHLQPGPPRVRFDDSTGESAETVEDWFFEMQASYTVFDLANYYTRKLGYESDQKPLIGMLKYTLKGLDADLCLFAIDVAVDKIRAGIYTHIEPIQIKNMKKEALEAQSQKRTEMTDLGVTGIVPRPRKPLPARRDWRQPEQPVSPQHLDEPF
jgi:hypothetical protein